MDSPSDKHESRQPKYERIVMRGPNAFDFEIRLPSGKLERRRIFPLRFAMKPNGTVRLNPPE